MVGVQAGEKTICLNMIVKDEKEVIEKCLGSVKHLIDYWVIVDTGSSDGTQEVIKKFLAGIPGELHERPWVNFAHNRNEALSFAKNKGDYLLLMDADQILQYSPNFSWPKLDKDFYFFTIRQLGAIDFKGIALIDTRLPWKWEGVMHELLSCAEAKTNAVLENVINVCNAVQGARATDPSHFLKDAAILEAALKEDPSNSRHVFYLAQSYLNAGKYDLALQNYIRRGNMSSPDVQETYWSLYMMGIIQELTDPEAALKSYTTAYQFRPTRAEPLYRMALIYRKKGNNLLTYLLLKYALTHPFPKDDMVVEQIVYDYGIPSEFANSALLNGKTQEALDACNKLQSNPNLPQETKTQITNWLCKIKIDDK